MNRSLLYVPGDRPDRVAKACLSEADGVIVDLEDAVKPAAKQLARATLRDLASVTRRADIAIWVRINSGDEGREDLRSMVGMDGIGGLVLAKCESPAWVQEVAAATPSTWMLSPLIESALAVRDIDAIVAGPRVAACHLGEVDLLADLRGAPPAGMKLIDAARIRVIVASAAAKIEPPIGGVHLQIDDLEALRASSDELAQLGFGGRAIVHPSHCAIVNTSFSPSAADREWASRLLVGYDAASDGAVRGEDGAMIDEAVVRRARRIMSQRWF